MNEQIRWNLVNSFLAGFLVFAGAFSDGNVTYAGLIAAISASLVVAITKFRDYWQGIQNKAFSFF